MTERKPPDVSFETWVEKQISEAVERGDFDNLPGAGNPIPDMDKPYDEVWVRNFLRREGLAADDLLPTPLRLRKEVERLRETVRPLRSEQAVRDLVDSLNEQIMTYLRMPLSGPRVPVAPVKVERVVEQWRADRAAAAEAAKADVAAEGNAVTEDATSKDATTVNTTTEERTARREPWWRRIGRWRRSD